MARHKKGDPTSLKMLRHRVRPGAIKGSMRFVKSVELTDEQVDAIEQFCA